MDRFQSFVDSTENLKRSDHQNYKPIYAEDHDHFKEMKDGLDASGGRLDKLREIRKNVREGSIRDSLFAGIVRDVLGSTETAKDDDLIEPIVVGKSTMVSVNKAHEAMLRKGKQGIFCTLKSKKEGLEKLDSFVFLFREYIFADLFRCPANR